MTAGRALMEGLVDYAGLFPPAGLEMLEAVRRYREYLAGEDRWALGRFVVPAARLAEFESAFEEVCCGEREPVWALSVLGTGDLSGLARGAVSVESVELKAGSVTEAERELAECGGEVPVYVEFDPGRASAMLPALAHAGARAKIRTGGVASEAFPSLETVAGFLLACARARVPFKATAGLHHAVRGDYKLTYEAQSARATMHGFANVFLAAVLAWCGAERRTVMETLGATEFQFGAENVRWLGFELSAEEIAAARRGFAVSYGSCSFEEPIAEAKALGWV
ncbi:MAG: hypothetical protein WBD10_15010 [Acidobacteriaceae bacterium]